MIIRKNTATLTKSCNMLNFIIILTAGPLDHGSGKKSIAELQQLKCKERLDKTVLPLLHNSRENKPQPMQPERESTRDSRLMPREGTMRSMINRPNKRHMICQGLPMHSKL
jgi:hypothetical protein